MMKNYFFKIIKCHTFLEPQARSDLNDDDDNNNDNKDIKEDNKEEDDDNDDDKFTRTSLQPSDQVSPCTKEGNYFLIYFIIFAPFHTSYLSMTIHQNIWLSFKYCDWH